MLKAGDRVKVTKGCQARSIPAHTRMVVCGVTPLGPEYSHQVKVAFKILNGFKSGALVSFYASHINRLSAPCIRFNDGDPTHTIEVVRA